MTIPPQLQVVQQVCEYDSWVSKVGKDIAQQTNAKEVKRQEIIFELFKTERNFLQGMLALKQVYQDSLLGEKIIKPDLVRTLFSNLDEVVAASYRMYTKMNELSNKDDFIKSVDYLFNEEFEVYKVFATFCSNQAIAKDHLSRERKKNDQFNKFLRDANLNPKCMRMKLDDMMIMPMQRITRYNLFLSALIEKSKNEDDCNLAKVALPRIKGVIDYVDMRTRRVSNVYELKRIQDQIVTENCVKLDLLDSPREFIRMGKLNIRGTINADAKGKKGSKEDDMQTIIIVSDMLIISTEKNNKLVVKDDPLMFKHIHVADNAASTTDKKSFFLINERNIERYEFCCFSSAEKKAWIGLIQDIQLKQQT